MSNKNITDILFIIDKSGSMHAMSDDTIGGFNSFLEKQKQLDGELNLTVVMFNHVYEITHDRVDLYSFPNMTQKDYQPAGGTALLDAMGAGILHLQDKIDNLPSKRKPDNVLCVVITDGQENSSLNYNKSQIKKMIDHQTKGHGWEFIFLGADIDAVSDAQGFGISQSVQYNHSAIGYQQVYDGLNLATKSVRCDGALDASWSSAITDIATTATTATLNIDTRDYK